MAHMSRRGVQARVAALFALSIGVRLLYVASIAPHDPIASVDAWGYHRLALNLSQGYGFSLRREPPHIADSIRTPLYPAFLWLVRTTIGPAPRTAAVVQAFLDGITTLLAWWLGAQLAGERAGRAAALLYALNPTVVRYVGDLLTETLLSFLIALTLVALFRYLRSSRANTPAARVWLVAVGIGSGLATLCKPNVQYFFLAWMLVIALYHCRQRWQACRAAALVILAMSAVLLPWILRNVSTFGRPFVSTAFEGNVSRVSAPAALVAAKGEYAPPWSTEWDARFGDIVRTAAARYKWSKPWDELTARELDTQNHQVYLVARALLLRHPWAWLLSHAQGMLRYLEPQTYRVCYARLTGRDWPPDVLDDALLHIVRAIGQGQWDEAGQIIAWERWSKLNHTQRVIWWSTLAGQIVGIALMVRGVWRLRRRPAHIAALILPTAYLLWVPGPIAYDRFRVPATALILVLAAAAMTDLDARGLAHL